MLISDGAADIGELALLGTSGYASMLVVPVVSRGESLGVLQAFSSAERPWGRSETIRARIIACQLGSVVELLSRRDVEAAAAG